MLTGWVIMIEGELYEDFDIYPTSRKIKHMIIMLEIFSECRPSLHT